MTLVTQLNIKTYPPVSLKLISLHLSVGVLTPTALQTSEYMQKSV